jgi:uncharacterized membrane protein YphA (DoxX/SURF4 family)
MTKTTKKYVILILQLIIAISYLQTLRFKFTAHPDSVYIFSKLNLEPYGRIGIGIFELIIAILILVPKTKIIAGMLSIAVITGAIVSHLGSLGIEVQNDNGTLFYFALFVFVSSLLFLWLQKDEVKLMFITLKHKLIKT